MPPPVKRSFTLSFPQGDLYDDFVRFMVDEGLESPGEAARTLIRRALAFKDSDGAAKAASERAYIEVKRLCLTKSHEYFEDMGKLVRSLIVTHDQTYGPPPEPTNDGGTTP